MTTTTRQYTFQPPIERGGFYENRVLPKLIEPPARHRCLRQRPRSSTAFAPKRLLSQPDEFWEALAGDGRIVRNPQKIMAVRANARFVADIAEEHGSFGKFLAQWPVERSGRPARAAGKRGARLGGRTGQYFLRFIGKDGFVTSADVVVCLRDAGLDIAEKPNLQEGPAEDPGPVQRLGRGDGAALHAPLAHLRHVDRRELRRRDAAQPRGRGGVREASLYVSPTRHPEASRGRGYPGPRPSRLPRSRLEALLACGSHRFGRDDG